MFFHKNGNDPSARNGRALPLLPLRDIIVFPHMVVPLFVGREKSINALEEAMSHNKEQLMRILAERCIARVLARTAGVWTPKSYVLSARA